MGKNKLRFKDENGNSYPSHNELLLGKVSSIKTGKKDANAMSDDGEYAFFTCSRQNYKIDKYSFDGKALLIAGNGDVGHVKYYEGKFDAYQRTYVVQDFHNVDPVYLKNFLDAKLPLRIAAEMQSGAMPYIKLSTLSEMPVVIPSLHEQRKIAALFSKLDERIELREQKIANLKDYKKGLQQAVFGNNGERTLRFKDDNGNDYPEWVEHKFGDVFDSIPIKKYQIPSSQVLQEGEFEVVDQGQKSIAGYSNDKTKLYSEVPVIVYGDHTTIIKYRAKPFVVGADGTKMLKTKDGVNILFALYSLDFNNVKPTGYNRHFSILREIKVDIPCVEEQKKIADLFSKIDNQIELEEQLLQAAKDAKQGLMQRVF